MDSLTRGPIIAEPEASPEVSRAVHADALVMARQDLLWSVVCAIAVAGAAWLLPRPLARSILQLPAVFVAMWLGRAAVQFVRLRAADPATALATEHQRASRENAEREAYQTWVLSQRPIATYVLAAGITAVTIIAWWGGQQALEAAALVKPAVRNGEWWRILSASFVHLNLMHLASNMVGLFILGRFVEMYDGRLRLMFVYLVSVIGSSVASVLLVANTSLGASGGILGLGGYLAVVGGRANSVMPAFVRGRTSMLLALTALSGAISYVTIDNAGHLGGVVAGALAGGIVLAIGQGRAGSRVPQLLSWTSAIILVGGAVATAALVVASGTPAVRGLDHVPVAVVSLEAAAERYRALGFTLKPGQPHANGIRNQHAKFADGTELELITAPEARDELTTYYRDFLAQGDGPAFVAFFAPNRSNATTRGIEATLPRYMFFGPRNMSPTDRPEHVQHANTAESLVSVWVAGADLSAEAQLLERMGARLTQETRDVPRPAPVLVAHFAEGEVLLLQTARDRAADRRIVGASVRVKSLAFAERLRIEGRGPVVVQRGPAASAFLPPELTHGLWLEFRQAR